MVPEIHHRVSGEQIPVAVVTIGRRVETVVGDRIDERLKRERRPSLLARQLRDDRREISAAAVTADGNAIRVHIQIGRMVRNPPGDRETIVDRRRKLGLRGEAVIYRDHAAAGAIGDPATHEVRRVEAPVTPIRRRETRPAPVTVPIRRRPDCRSARGTSPAGPGTVRLTTAPTASPSGRGNEAIKARRSDGLPPTDTPICAMMSMTARVCGWIGTTTPPAVRIDAARRRSLPSPAVQRNRVGDAIDELW